MPRSQDKTLRTTLFDGSQNKPPLVPRMDEAGSVLRTSRNPPFQQMGAQQRADSLRKVVNTALITDSLDILYVIGGDGAMRAAHAISNTAIAMKKDPNTDLPHGLTVVGVPKTMDNDILWVWASFGFQSAVQRSTEIVRHLWTEASSNPRLGVIQLFGSESGFLVTDAAASSGKCDLYLIPESPFSLDAAARHLAERMRERNYAIVVMAETAVPIDEDVKKYTSQDDNSIGLTEDEKKALNDHINKGRRIVGQTPDDLRSSSLKLVSRVLKDKLIDPHGFDGLRLFTNEPRHVIRASPPSSSDIIYARRLGVHAVDGAMAGHSDFMISQWLTEYVMVPLDLVVLGRKRVPYKGAFCSFARASTGQPADLTK